MPNMLRIRSRLTCALAFAVALTNFAIAQTNPAAQTLPFNFTSQAGGTLPAGIAVHALATLPTSRTTAAGAADLPNITNTNQGGWRAQGSDGIGLLASGSAPAGALVVAINTTGLTNISVSWICKTVFAQNTRDNSVALQYRVGTSGTFTDVGTLTTYTSAGKLVNDVSATLTETLPAAAEGQPVVQVRWIYWESVSTGGSRDRIAIDDIAITSGPAGPDVTAPVISERTPGDNAINVATNSNLQITFSENVTALSGNITITNTGDLSSQSIAVTDPSVSVAGNVVSIAGVSLSNGQSYAVTTDAGTFEDAAGNDFAGESDPSTWNFSTVPAAGTPTKISAIQGTTTTATEGTYTIEGIVTGVYPDWSPAGYYIQEEDLDADGDEATAEGIFVVQANPAVNVGEKVLILGSVIENNLTPSFGQAVITPLSTTVVSPANPLPLPVEIALPALSAVYQERYEGMLVKYTGALTVTDNFQLGSFGSIKLSQNGLVYQPTQLVDPNDATPTGTTSTGTSNVSAVTDLLNQNNLRTIILDDGRNPAPTTLPFVNSDNTLRVGSTIENVTGILAYGFNAYRIQTLPAGHPYATPSNFNYAARPVDVPSIGSNASVKVASFNVLNYFNGDGSGGGFPTSRGASSLAEFNRQRTKIISALSKINADIVGLIEIENDGAGPNSALADLVNGLNAVLGADIYALIDDATVPNTDEIKCAIIYKPAVVTPIGAVMTSSNGVFNRPPVSQNFRYSASTDVDFNYIINHFKSKSCSGASGQNADLGDGQSCFNESRKQQADALIEFIAAVKTESGNNNIITMGDYNAYYEEDPLDILRAGGYHVLAAATEFSYSFSGQVGSLDHALVSTSLNKFITGVAKWNINSLEPEYLFYKDGINSGGGDEINPWASTYTADQWRSSDHDAVILGLDLSTALPVTLVSVDAKPMADRVVVSWSTAEEINNSHFTVERAADAVHFNSIGELDAAGTSSRAKSYSFNDLTPLEGISYYRLKQTDLDGTFTVSRIMKINRNGGSASALSVYPNPVSDQINLESTEMPGNALQYEIISTKGTTLSNGAGSLTEIRKEINHMVPNMKAGIYIIRIKNGYKSQAAKFVKQ